MVSYFHYLCLTIDNCTVAINFKQGCSAKYRWVNLSQVSLPTNCLPSYSWSENRYVHWSKISPVDLYTGTDQRTYLAFFSVIIIQITCFIWKTRSCWNWSIKIHGRLMDRGRAFNHSPVIWTIFFMSIVLQTPKSIRTLWKYEVVKTQHWWLHQRLKTHQIM